MAGVCILFYITCGCVFLDSHLSTNFEQTYSSLGSILLVSTALTISAVLVLFVLDVHGSRKAVKIGTTVMSSLTRSIQRIQASLSEDVLQIYNDNGWDGVQPYLKRGDLELIEAVCSVDGKFDDEIALSMLFPACSRQKSVLGKALSRMASVSGRQPSQSCAVSKAVGTNQLMHTIEPGPLLTWVGSALCTDNEAGTQQLVRYLRINHILGPWLEDEAKYSAYGNNRHGRTDAHCTHTHAQSTHRACRHSRTHTYSTQKCTEHELTRKRMRARTHTQFAQSMHKEHARSSAHERARTHERAHTHARVHACTEHASMHVCTERACTAHMHTRIGKPCSIASCSVQIPTYSMLCSKVRLSSSHNLQVL